ncbi:MAG TPA: metallophosphoesterase [Syntrophorhabdaceae bacterium]|nr:metallophosphoesterase [Syntrophorhabdaceae bacterium]
MIKRTMLVVVSDLHLSDGTAANNLSPRAFKHFHNLIKRSIRDNTKEIILVFAGDTFDLLRSEYWMTVEDNEKPWAIGSGETHKKQNHLKNIFSNIIDSNRDGLNLIKETDEVFDPIPVRRVIILGNHDRMLNEFSHLQDTLSSIIGKVQVETTGYENEEYGILIKHGHEYDEYNYETHGIPIGDVNTTELFVRLPYEIKMEFPLLADELKCIEDIRPQWRIFDYLFHEYQERRLKSYIEKAVDRTIEAFFNIPYVRYWIKAHDTSHILDASDKLKYMLYLSKFAPIEWAERFLKIFSYFEINEPKYEEMAATHKTLYTVFGHTHSEKIAFLSEKDNLHRYYINTGTWRERIIASQTGSFSRYKSMTFAIFYKKEERTTDFPSFELWNGALRE